MRSKIWSCSDHLSLVSALWEVLYSALVKRPSIIAPYARVPISWTPLRSRSKIPTSFGCIAWLSCNVYSCRVFSAWNRFLCLRCDFPSFHTVCNIKLEAVISLPVHACVYTNRVESDFEKSHCLDVLRLLAEREADTQMFVFFANFITFNIYSFMQPQLGSKSTIY